MKSKFKNFKTYLYRKNFYHLLKSSALSIISYTLNKYFFLFKNRKRSIEENKIYSKGYVYTAFGQNFYKECINSVKLLKLTTTLPIHLFTDQKVSEEEKLLFYSINYVPNLHARSKVDYIGLSPFNKTIYLDTDVIVVKKIDELFDLLDKYNILATLDTARKRENISKKISEYSKIPYSFGEVNSGLLCFNDFAKENIIKKWPKVFYKYIKESGGWDQPSLRILLWKSNASLYILPPEFNIRSKKLIEKVKNNKHLFGEEHMSPRVYHLHLYEEIYTNKINEVISLKDMVAKAKKNAYEINY